MAVRQESKDDEVKCMIVLVQICKRPIRRVLPDRDGGSCPKSLLLSLCFSSSSLTLQNVF